MWRALELVSQRVAPGGKLFVAIYNDQLWKSQFWRAVKRTYNALPRPARIPFVVTVMAPFELRVLARDLVQGEPERYLHSWTRYESARGMSRWHDLVDWVGGYPFEVASPESLLTFYGQRGFSIDRLERTNSLGCNQLVLTRVE
jgi:2-polyprenyl-6-hydroxyphenyl methylase/3-demethylubiquinone-9 3-methyltransferase